MTKKDAQKLLRQFQCNYNRELEESFAQTFSENEAVRLFFINENEAFTDGRNIVVDPASDNLYYDTKALVNTEIWLGWSETVSVDPWCALRIITRAQTIHECLHILYTDFPCGAATDPCCDTKNKKKTMAMISNIIEDAYIEAVGCTVYDNLELYLLFGRVSRLFITHPSLGTVYRAFDISAKKEEAEVPPLISYLNYVVDFLLYPMVRQGVPEAAVASYVEQTKELLLQGCKMPSPDERYKTCQDIFKIILPLIPPDEVLLNTDTVSVLVGGSKTHSAVSGTMGAERRKGKAQSVSTRLFTDSEGSPRNIPSHNGQLAAAASEFAAQKQAALELITAQGFTLSFHGKDFDCAVMHKDVQIIENHPRINLNLQKAYQNIYNRYRINIDSYNGRFLHLLKAQVSVRDEKQLFGAGISSRQLGDVKRRYWYKNSYGIDVPDLAVLLLIDGSGSMHGERRSAAIISSVILHEVLQKQGIAHAVVEHRAEFEEPKIDVNILVDFSGRKEEKLNLMQIDAYGDNRDALALFWAERYINQKTTSQDKLVIVLSDGVPAHDYDEYYPPVSIKDTANAVAKIQQRGTQIVAVALDNGDPSASCYEMLREIYPSLIDCTDLKRLTGQLLTLVSRSLESYF